MPVPSAITDLSQTAGSNYPAGSESPNTADDYFRAHASFLAQLRDGIGFTDPVTLVSAATTSIGAQNSQFVEISGTTGITSFGTTYNGPRFLRFTGVLTLTHSSTLNLPGAANITTAAGDTCIAVPNITPNGWNVVSYQRASGAALVDNGVSAGAITTSGLTMATARILGRTTALTGAVEELTAAQVAAFTAAASDTAQGAVELATTAEVQTGTSTTLVPSVSSLRGGFTTLSAPVATTSGTSVSISSSVPSWAKRIVLGFNAVSTSGTSAPIIQIGDSGGLENSGYVGCVNTLGVAATNFSTGFMLASSHSGAAIFSGSLVLELIDSSTNTWSCSFNLGRSDASNFNVGAGVKALSGVLDRVSITTVGGTETFDAGSISINWS